VATVYFDASALVKLVVPEDGSDLAEALWNGSDLSVANRLAAVEVRAAVGAASREGRLDDSERELALYGWARVAESISLVDPEPSVIGAACEVAERYALRALDAVHLASALLLAETPVVVASWDRRLRAAALDAGLGLAPAAL
jgi:predicted nucleic acid-binding protein